MAKNLNGVPDGQLQIGNSTNHEENQPNEAQYEIISGRLFDVPMGYNWIVFKRDQVVLSSEVTTKVILVQNIIKIHVQVEKRCVVIVESPSTNSLVNDSSITYLFALRGNVSNILSIFSDGIAISSDYCDLLKNAIPENQKRKVIANNTKSSVRVRDYSILDGIDWFNDQLLDCSLHWILESFTPSIGEKKVVVIDTMLVNSLEKYPQQHEAFYKKVQQNLRRTKLLEHDFIAFPLNVTNEHWILLIVCFPDLDGCYDLETGERCETPKSTIASVENFYRVPAHLMRTPGKSPYINPELQSGLQSIRQIKSLKEYANQGSTPTKRRRIKQPCILVFDSSHNYGDRIHKLVEIVKRFFTCRQRMEGKYNVNFNEIIVHVPEVQKQLNTSDCGVYVLHFLHDFLLFTQSDAFDLTLPITKMKNAAPSEEVKFTRRRIASKFRMTNPQQQDYPILLPSDAFYEETPDREDDGLA